MKNEITLNGKLKSGSGFNQGSMSRGGHKLKGLGVKFGQATLRLSRLLRLCTKEFLVNLLKRRCKAGQTSDVGILERTHYDSNGKGFVTEKSLTLQTEQIEQIAPDVFELEELPIIGPICEPASVYLQHSQTGEFDSREDNNGPRQDINTNKESNSEDNGTTNSATDTGGNSPNHQRNNRRNGRNTKNWLSSAWNKLRPGVRRLAMWVTGRFRGVSCVIRGIFNLGTVGDSIAAFGRLIFLSNLAYYTPFAIKGLFSLGSLAPHAFSLSGFSFLSLTTGAGLFFGGLASLGVIVHAFHRFRVNINPNLVGTVYSGRGLVDFTRSTAYWTMLLGITPLIWALGKWASTVTPGFWPIVMSGFKNTTVDLIPASPTIGNLASQLLDPAFIGGLFLIYFGGLLHSRHVRNRALATGGDGRTVNATELRTMYTVAPIVRGEGAPSTGSASDSPVGQPITEAAITGEISSELTE